MLINNKILIGLMLLIGLSISVGTFYFFGDELIRQSKPEEKNIEQKEEKKINHGPCLTEDKIIEYKIEKNEDNGDNAIVFIKDKIANKDIFKFQINNIIYNHYHGYESHKCNIYIIRQFYYDKILKRRTPDYKVELWGYNYGGSGSSLLEFSKTDNQGNYVFLYNDDFRINPNEHHLVLEKGYLGQDDYALVIKDLNTKEDIFVLLAKDIIKQYPDIIGGFRMREWSKDGRYFWGHIFEGAYISGYFRVDTQNWKVDIFEVPNGAMGGLPLNINTGYAVIQPGYIWTGIEELTQELKEQYREEGRKSYLYIYNLFTKEKILIETVDEPLWLFKSRWLSDAELQYELPNGEKKIYKIQ